MVFVKTLEFTKEQVHDLREAVRTMTLALVEMKSGYKFDDDAGAQKLAYIERAIDILKTTLQSALN